MPHLTQIVATNIETGGKFNLYVRPGCPIAMDAQRITGISLNYSTMYVHGTDVESSQIGYTLSSKDIIIFIHEMMCFFLQKSCIIMIILLKF